MTAGKDRKGNEITESDIGDIYQFHQYGVEHDICGKAGPYRSREKLLLLGIRPEVESLNAEVWKPKAFIFLRLKTGTKVYWRGGRLKHLKKVLALPEKRE